MRGPAAARPALLNGQTDSSRDFSVCATYWALLLCWLVACATALVFVSRKRAGGSDAIFSAKCSDPSAASICHYQVARRSLACDTRLFISFALFSSSWRARERKVHSHSRCTCKSSELHSAESLTGDGVKWRHCVKWIENRQHRFFLESRRSLSFILWECSSTLQPRTKD